MITMMRVAALLGCAVVPACGDDTHAIYLHDAPPDACIFHDDASTSECCNLSPSEATACARRIAQPGTCVSISCFYGCEIEKVQGCNLGDGGVD